MKPAFAPRLPAAAVALAFAGTAVSAGEINSNLQIEAGKTFELGGGQPGGFTVTGRNTGPVAVVVLAKGAGESGGAAVVKGRVEPGANVDAAFGAGEQALLRNTSDSRMARMKLVVRGDTSSLGMTYSANP
ncbi:hypothetical protein [Erythrobacter oryzae]|uniref:hypothetical protein n=1 Tax=Erythrobacter oryzae TaxID=3019556 RepID=UPI002553369C|nr:hypothetical protein [Erythrobacter sp. COR-2]